MRVRLVGLGVVGDEPQPLAPLLDHLGDGADVLARGHRRGGVLPHNRDARAFREVERRRRGAGRRPHARRRGELLACRGRLRGGLDDCGARRDAAAQQLQLDVELSDVSHTSGAAVVFPHEVDGAVGARIDAHEVALGGPWPVAAALWSARLLLLVVHDTGAKQEQRPVLIDGRDLAVVALVARLLLAAARLEVDEVLCVNARREQKRRTFVRALQHGLGGARDDVVVDLGGANGLVMLARRDSHGDPKLGPAPVLQGDEIGAGVEDEHFRVVARGLGMG